MLLQYVLRTIELVVPVRRSEKVVCDIDMSLRHQRLSNKSFIFRRIKNPRCLIFLTLINIH